jgi:hypothetical protein
MSKSILKSTSRCSDPINDSDGLATSGQSSEGSDTDRSHQSAHNGRTGPVSVSLHHVHFASDTSIYLTHSTADYDRSPMKVMKNPCALPARGCPGLTYVTIDDGPGGRQRGVRDFDAIPNCMDESGDESSESEENERTGCGWNLKGGNRDRPCQRYALKVSVQKRRQKLNESDVLHLRGFRPLATFSSMVTSTPDDCFGGF